MKAYRRLGRYEYLLDYSFLVRFGVLVLIWALVAFKFKFLLDLSIRGFLTSILFFAGNVLVFFGYRTRTAMTVVVATLLLEGLTFHDRLAILCAILAGLSLVLPIGRYVSFDRYLELRARPAPYVPDAVTRATPLAWGWKIAFVALATFLVGGPAYNQVFHHDNRYLISWHMFHRVGRDLVIVRFTHGAGAQVTNVDYRPLLGAKIEHVGVFKNKDVKDMKIVGIPHLQRVIAAVCRAHTDPANLHLEARLATLIDGWHTLYDGTEPVCTAEGQAIARTFPRIETGIPGSSTEIF